MSEFQPLSMVRDFHELDAVKPSHRFITGTSNDRRSQKSFAKLKQHENAHIDRQISQLFDSDADRFETFSASCGDVLFDYSKNNITNETLDLFD